MVGTLYVVGTPIGNLKDITLRALDTLRDVDVVLAEDTRVTKKLLSHYEIQKPVWRFDENVSEKSYREVKDRLELGQQIAFVTDAGTPGIADPGWKLVSYLRKELPTAKIVPIPGASAIATVLSVSGLNADEFVFLGYPPHKKGRKTFFEKLAALTVRPVVIYESPHRFQKTLLNLSVVVGETHEIIVGRELTKMFEDLYHGTIADAQTYFVGVKAKGEFVIVLP